MTEKIAALLAESGVAGQIREFADTTKTAAQAAAALGCEVGAIANSLVFMADSEPILILASGSHRVDTEFVAATIGVASLARATPEQVRAATGQVIGGVAPIGHPSPLRSYIDLALADYDPIWAAAGSAHSVFPTTFAELAVLARAQEIDVVPPGQETI